VTSERLFLFKMRESRPGKNFNYSLDRKRKKERKERRKEGRKEGRKERKQTQALRKHRLI
jgi:hypothetical protein